MGRLSEKLNRIRSEWTLEGAFQSIGMLLSANLMVAVLGLGTLVLSAHALGPAGIGILALIEAYGRSVDQVFRFEPSQAVIRYGSAALEKEDDESFRRLVKFATIMDFAGAAMAALLAYLGLKYASQWVGFDAEETRMATWFILSMLFYVSATPVAMLRLLSRFKLYAKILVGVAALRFVLTAALWYFEAELKHFLILIIAYSIAEHLIPLAMAWRELRKRNGKPILSLPLRGFLSENKGIFRFMFNANMNVLARNSTRQVDTLVIGGLVGAAEVGFYQIAKRVGIAALRLSRPAQFVIFPMLTRLWQKGQPDRLVALVFRLGAVLGSIGVLAFFGFLLFGNLFIEIAFGAEFLPAKLLISLHIVAASILLFGTSLNAALLSIDQDGALLKVTLLATFIFFVALAPSVQMFGIVAASCLHIVFNIVWTTGCLRVFLGNVNNGPKDSNR